jgi:beta-galactosidase
LTVSRPRLWHFDHPYLYRWSTAWQTVEGQFLDTAEERFGVRLIELRQAQLYLNSEPVRLVGLTRHADSSEDGLPETITMAKAVEVASCQALAILPRLG